MRCKIQYFTTGKQFKEIIVTKINSGSKLWNRALLEWSKDEKLQAEVKGYMKEHFPNAKYVTVGLGIGTSYCNPKRVQKSIQFRGA